MKCNVLPQKVQSLDGHLDRTPTRELAVHLDHLEHALRLRLVRHRQELCVGLSLGRLNGLDRLEVDNSFFGHVDHARARAGKAVKKLLLRADALIAFVAQGTLLVHVILQKQLF